MPRGRPPAASGPHTAERIRIAATRLFYEKGFVASTIRHLAEASGLTPGAIYNHFRSKEEILDAIVTWSHDELERDLAEALASAGDAPRDRLRAVVVAFVLRHSRYPEAARVSNRDYVFLGQSLRSRVVERRRSTRALFERLIEEGVTANQMRVPRLESEVASRVSTEILAMDLINMAVMVSEWYRPNGLLSAAEVATLQAEIALQLVGGCVAVEVAGGRR